jgi:MFS family permease
MHHRHNSLRRATLLLGSTLTVMAGAIIAPALPQISREFAHIANAELLSKLVLTIPALFMALLAPVAGYFIDKNGRKKVLLVSLIAYAAAGTSGLYLDNLYFILIGRAFLGIAVGALVTAIITLIGDYWEGDQRSKFVGLQAAFAGMGGLVFISSGGVLADIHWRLPFLIYITSLIVWVMATISVYEPDVKSKVFHEIKPQKAAIPGMVMFVYGVSFVSMIVFYMIPVQMPFMLSAMEVSNTHIGFAIASMNVASVLTSVNYSRIRKRLSFPMIMAVVYFIIAVGFVIISQTSSYTMMIAGIMVCGLGFGMMMPNINLWLISIAPMEMRGRLVGYLNSAVFLGMFLSPVALQPLIMISSLYTSFFLVAVILLVGSMLFFVAGRKLT